MKKKQALIVSENIIWSQMEKEIVIINLTKGVYFSLNETGTTIFLFILRNKSFDSIVSWFQRKYKISGYDSMIDIDRFIQELLNNNIIKELDRI